MTIDDLIHAQDFAVNRNPSIVSAFSLAAAPAFSDRAYSEPEI